MSGARTASSDCNLFGPTSAPRAPPPEVGGFIAESLSVSSAFILLRLSFGLSPSFLELNDKLLQTVIHKLTSFMSRISHLFCEVVRFVAFLAQMDS